MIPAAFEYHAPKTLEEALRLYERHGDEAKVLAGGHSLLPLMKLRLAAPRYIIDIGRLRGMNYIREEGSHILLGALTTHGEIEASEALRAQCPLLPETAAEIGDVQVRNRGTIGGSLAHADPAADWPAAMLALDAEFLLASTSGTRTVPADGFFVDMLTTQLRPGEILSQVRLPRPATGTGMAYCKLHQLASGFAIVGVATRIALDHAGKLREVAVGITGVGPKAYRARATEKMLLSKSPTRKALADAARHAADEVEALSDLHASSEYRRQMAAVFVRRALEKALGRARLAAPNSAARVAEVPAKAGPSARANQRGQRKAMPKSEG